MSRPFRVTLMHSHGALCYEVHESEFEVVRTVFKRMRADVPSVILHLDRPDFLDHARWEDIPRHLERIEVSYRATSLPSTNLVDGNGYPLHRSVPGPCYQTVSRESVERFAGLLNGIAFSYSCNEPGDTLVTYTPESGWQREYFP